MRGRLLAGLVAVSLVVTLVGGARPAAGELRPPEWVNFLADDPAVLVDTASRVLDPAPVTIHDQLYVPLRAFSEILRAKTAYLAGTGSISVTLLGRTVILFIDQPWAIVGSSLREIDPQDARVVPLLRSGQPMLPLRFTAESLGIRVFRHGPDGSISLFLHDLLAELEEAGPDGTAQQPPDAGGEEPAETGGTPPRVTETGLDPSEEQGRPPIPPGHYRVAGIVLDGGTRKPLAYVAVLARTDYGASLQTARNPAVMYASAAVTEGPLVGPSHPATADDPPGSHETPAPPAPESKPVPPPVEPEKRPVREYRAETGPDGTFYLDLPEGAAHRVTVSESCYAMREFLVSRSARHEISLPAFTAPPDTPLEPGAFRIRGEVKDQGGKPVAGACVSASPPTTYRSAAGVQLPAITSYMTDQNGSFFIDWKQWLPVVLEATASGCGNQVQLTWVQADQPAGRTAESGPVNVGYSPDPAEEKIPIPGEPYVQKDLTVTCTGPIVVIYPGGSGTSLCRQSVGTDNGWVRLDYSGSFAGLGGQVLLTAKPVGNRPVEKVLRWWLDDRHQGALHVNGCTATFVATNSMGTVSQYYAHIRVAKEGQRRPIGNWIEYSGMGWRRISVHGSSGSASGCNAALVSITSTGNHFITRVWIKGIGTWNTAAYTVNISTVPVGVYSVFVTTSSGRTHEFTNAGIKCPVGSFWVKGD
jgi:hypothetical protein